MKIDRACLTNVSLLYVVLHLLDIRDQVLVEISRMCSPTYHKCKSIFLKPDIFEKFDKIMKDALENILNIDLHERVYDQATLPVALGG